MSRIKGTIALMTIVALFFTTAVAYGGEEIVGNSSQQPQSTRQPAGQTQASEQGKPTEQLEEEAFGGDDLVRYGEGASPFYIDAPLIKSWKRTSSTEMTLTWEANPEASGYEIQYALCKSFEDEMTVKVEDNLTTTTAISDLIENEKYYVKIRAYKTLEEDTLFSEWSVFIGVKKDRSAAISVVKKKGKIYELRSQTKQTLYQYDTLQGSCTDGTYGYYLMYNRKVERCKIAKVRLSNMTLVKVSSVLSVAHGNDVTYDSGKKRLVVVHCTYKSKASKKVSLVRPDTLKIEKNMTIATPEQLPGATDSQLKAITGYSGIAYNSCRGQYILKLQKSHNFLITDSELNPIKYVVTTKKNNYIYQGIDATDDNILIGQSPKYGSQYNIISVYDWDGEYLYKINLKKSYELESIFHIGEKTYAGFYRSYYKTYYKIKTKWVKKHGWYIKKKVRVEYKKLIRSNYIYSARSI